MPERPNMWYIFEKRIVQGYQQKNSMCQTCKYKNTNIQIHKYTNIQKHKYTNTQIQHMTKCQKDPTCAIFLKRVLFKDITNDIPICQTGKYKNASTQIHKYRAHNEVTEKTCGIFLK